MKTKTGSRVKRLLLACLVAALAFGNSGTIMALADGTQGDETSKHTHTQECYETNCVHVHEAACYSDGKLPAEGEEKEADACTHVCSEESGCVVLTCTKTETTEESQGDETGERSDKKSGDDADDTSGDANALKVTRAGDETGFEPGMTVTYYAPKSKNEIIGALSDFNADGTPKSWKDGFIGAGVQYSEKTVSDTNDASFCSYDCYEDQVDFGDGPEAAYVVKKTYHTAVPAEKIWAEGLTDQGKQGYMFNGKGTGLAALSGYRFLAYNTQPDGNGTWYRYGQSLPTEGDMKLYAQFVNPLTMSSQLGNMTKDVKVGIKINGAEGYTEEAPYEIPVAGTFLQEDALYYTAYLNLGETISRLIWARTDELEQGIEATCVKLTINIDPRLELSTDNGNLVFQYTGGFVPYVNDQFLTPDSGSTNVYTVSIPETEIQNNSFTLRLGLDGMTAMENPNLTLEEFSEMSLSVAGKKGAEAKIPEELAKSAVEAGVAVDSSDASFIKADGMLEVKASLAGGSPNTRNVEVTPAYAQLIKKDAKDGTITVKAEDLTAYTGGTSLSQDSFPTARYDVELPDGVNLEDVEFTVGDQTFQAEDTQNAVIQELEETFTYQDGQTSDTQASTHDGKPGLYEIGIEEEGQIKAEANGRAYQVVFEPGELTVRYVSEPEAVLEDVDAIAAPVLDEAPAEEPERAVAVADSDTQYLTNGKAGMEVLGAAEGQEPVISLLSDSLLNAQENETDREELLTEKAVTYLEKEGVSVAGRNYEFQYLDLINETDGNAWVSSSEGTDIYYPYPEGTDMNTEFTVLHFKDLHREYGFKGPEVEEAVKAAEVETVKVTNTEQGIKFHIPESGFSPFAFTWQDTDGQGGNQSGNAGTSDDKSGGVRTGDPNSLILWAALAAVSAGAAGFAMSRRRRNRS